MRKIEHLEQSRGALQRGDPLPEPGQGSTIDQNKNTWTDAKTTGKIALLYPVAGKLGRGEDELQLRTLTKDLVADHMAEGDIAAIESVAGMKVADMKWQDFDRAAEKHYGTEKKEGQWIGRSKWRGLLRGLMGFQEGDEDEPSTEPAFPMAQELIGGSLRTGNYNFYENFIRPKFSNDTPELAENMIAAVQEVSKGYQASTKESVDKTMVAEDAVWFNPLTYFDEDTKDPYHDFTGFIHTMGQQTGNIGAMIIAARTGGRVGARSYTKSLNRPGLSTADIQGMQRIGGRIGGAGAGGKAEMSLIRDGVFTEAHESILNEIPQETWERHDPYLRLVNGGLTSEEAKQVIAYSHANNAGDMAMVLSGAMMGTPMGAFYGSLTGRSAGRQLAKESIIKQMGKGFALETGQEMGQEFVEQVSSNLAISRVDPDQDLYEGGLEAVVTAFFISGVPGAIGGIHSDRGAGIAADTDALIRKSQPWVNAANERWKHQNKVGPNTAFAKDASPQDQLKAMLELERLQKKEAQEFTKISNDVRALHEKSGVAQDKRLAFEAQNAGYESLLANIAKQQTRRSESKKALNEEKRIAKERGDAQKAVERDVQSIAEAETLVDQLNSIQKGEPLEKADYETLAKNGYGKYSGRQGELFVLTPRGVRAIPEINAMINQKRQKLESGYPGQERRGDAQRRELVQNMTDEEFEKQVYTDADTELRNKRAWNEESGDHKAVAVLDADSLKWVNDNMSHSAGTEYLKKIANELKELGGSTVSYRYGGDEFIVGAKNREELETAVEAAVSRINQATRVEEGGQSVKPSVTVGYGASFDEADTAMSAEKADKTSRGERAGRDQAPPSFRTVVDDESPQLTMFHYQDDLFTEEINNLDGYWEEYQRTHNIKNKAQQLHVRPVTDQQMGWIESIANDFLPPTNSNNPPVTIVHDPAELHDVSPRQYDELLDIGFNIWGVRGLFSLDDPSHGVFLIASNIVQQAEKGLTKGQRITSWRSARVVTKEGDQVEVISRRGDVKRAVITNIKSEMPVYSLPKKSMSQRRTENKLKNKTRELANWRKHVNKLENRAENLSDEEFNNFDNPLIIKLDDAIEKLYDIQYELQSLKITHDLTRAERLQTYKPADTTDDRITVKMPDGKEITFDPNKNEVVGSKTKGNLSAAKASVKRWLTTETTPIPANRGAVTNAIASLAELNDAAYNQINELLIAAGDNKTFGAELKAIMTAHNITEAALADEMVSIPVESKRRETAAGYLTSEGVVLGRIRGKVYGKGEGWSSFWHDNLGNEAAATDEKLTKDHVREIVADTLMHETVGHYGIRGITRDYKTYERLTHNIVDAFPDEVAALQRMGYKYRDELSVSQNKALLGEEVMAWRIGEIFYSQKEMTPVQRTAVQRFMTWLKEQLLRLGFGRVYYGAKGLRVKGLTARIDQLKKVKYADRDHDLIKKLESRLKRMKSRGFLSDGDLMTVIARSHDYIRNGQQKWKFTGSDGQLHFLPMRDAEIFMPPVSHVVEGGTRELDEGETMPTDEDYGVALEPVSMAEAYLEVTGRQMPSDWAPVTPGTFKDQSKAMMADKDGATFKAYQEAREAAGGKLGPPVFLYNRATEGWSDEQKALAGQVQKVIAKSKEAAKQQQERARKLDYRKEVNRVLRQHFGDEAVDRGKIPLFPETTTIQGYVEAVNEAVSRGHLSKMEVEASGIFNKIYPSRVDKLMGMAGGSVEDLSSLTFKQYDTITAGNVTLENTERGITAKRLTELRAPATRMTAEEAQIMADLVGWEDPASSTMSGVTPVRVLESVPAEWAFKEEWESNNGLTLDDVSNFFIDLAPQVNWINSVLGDHHETAEAYNATRKLHDDPNATQDQKRAALDGMRAISNLAVPTTSVNLPKAWVLDAIKKPDYEIIVGDPKPPTRNRSQVYKDITGEQMPNDYDRFADANSEMEQKINDELEKDARYGPDIGYNERTQTWYDPLSDYGGESGAWQQLRVPGMIDGTFRAFVFFQVPSAGAKGSSQHYSFANLQQGRGSGIRGSVGHTRQGMSHDADPNPPIADNPDNQGKAISLYESQADNAQRINKRYASPEIERIANELHASDENALAESYHHMLQGVANAFIDVVEEKYDDILSTEVERQQNLTLMFTPEQQAGMDDLDKQMLVEKYRMNSLNVPMVGLFRDAIQAVQAKYQTSADRYNKMISEGTRAAQGGLLGSDARAFQVLDDVAKTQALKAMENAVVGGMQDEFRVLSTVSFGSDLWNTLKAAGGLAASFRASTDTNKENMVSGKEFRTALIAAAGRGTHNDKASYGYRFNAIEGQTRQMLLEVFEELTPNGLFGGVSAADRVNAIWEDMQDVTYASIEFDTTNMSDILGMDTYAVETMLDSFEDWITTIAGPSVSVNSYVESEKAQFSFTGRKEYVAQFEKDFRGHLATYINAKWGEQRQSSLRSQIHDAEARLDQARNRTRTIRRNQAKQQHEMEEVYAYTSYTGRQDNRTYSYKTNDNLLTKEDGDALLASHEALTFEEYVTETWRRAYPRMENNEQYDENVPPQWKRDEYRNKYQDSRPFVVTGNLPVAWDSDGKPTERVQLNIVRKYPGQEPLLRISGEDVQTFTNQYYSDQRYGRAITAWYADKNIIPPSNAALFGADPDVERYQTEITELQTQMDDDQVDTMETSEQSTTDVPPKFDKSTEYGDLAKAFDNEIAFYKRSGVQAPNLIERNEQYRLNHIQALFSDLARRGIPRMFFFPGTASGARGAFISGLDSMEGLDRAPIEMMITEKIKWSLHRKEIRGEQRDVIIIESEDINEPLWVDVTGDKLLTFNPKKKISKGSDELAGYFSSELSAQLGRYVAENIAMKIKHSKVLGSKVEDGDKLLISHTPDDLWVVHNRAGVVIDTVANEEQARTVRDNYEQRPAEDTVTEETALSISGVVTEGELGVPIHLLKTRYHGAGVPYPLQSLDYQHTISRSTMEGGRRNYDMTFMTTMREYAAKYDMKIEEGVMKVPSSKMELAVRAHGLPRVVQLEQSAAEQFTNIQIEQVAGENFGFIVNSDAGLVTPHVYHSEQAAAEGLRAWIDQHTVPDTGIVKVYQITMSDKAKTAHKKGVSPFIAASYKMNPDLKAAHEKIGSNEPRLIDRFNAWRKSWRANANIGMFDRLYGIRHAIENQGIEGLDAAEDPYVQARMTTGLESMMRGIMEFGHPVRREGVIENDGKGLLEVLSPIAGDVELWALYMAGVRAKRLLSEDREKLFTPEQIDAMVNLGEEFPVFKEVAAEYAKFNKKMLDFAESSGVINAETRPLWENADYIPFYRIADDRLVGPLAKGVGIANQRSPIKTLKGGEANLGDLIHNIFANLTNLMDSSIKNHAALMSIDMLQESGVIRKQPYSYSKELFPMTQVAKILQQNGIDIKGLPDEVTKGLQTMFAIQPPEGPGIISVLRKGKKEYYFTEDELLYRSLAAINIKSFGAWMNLLRAPKRLLTSWVTLDPGFMIANFIRDSMSAFVLSRDKFIPLASGLNGFRKAITQDDTMKTMIGAGAAFESGYINQGDPNAARRQVKRAMKDAGFQRTVLNTPRKMYNAWKRIGSASENANRIAVYQAAIRAGKSKAQALYESKDLMDFSMGGDWPFIQFLIQTVPFLGARMQGIQRLGRGAAENPTAFAMKGALLTMAGMALWFAFRDDERYKDLEDWDKDTYFHWWIGDEHFRLPKGFEVGAIFNTVPERIFEYMYSEENDAGKLLMQRWGFMLAETFNMNPMPQAFRPMVESWMNKNFFRDSSIESPYEEQRLPPERYRHYTSPTMIELARVLPKELDLASEKIRSPLHLQNLYSGYTGTLGRYIVMASDVVVRHMMDYPERADMTAAMYPVSGRFFRGSAPRKTRYEEEFYNMLRTTLQVKDSLKFLDQKELDARFDQIEKEYAPYVEAAADLEGFRKEISDLNKEIREINEDKKIKDRVTGKPATDQGAEKRRQINEIQLEKNQVFKEAWELRPAAQEENQTTSINSVEFLIKNFNVDATDANDELMKKAPVTAELVSGVATMPEAQLKRIARTSAGDE
jgi:diguanylate cyclase (GGDEF)-like protein